MGQQRIDPHTADRLLSGVLAPEDAPPGFADVAVLLRAAQMPPAPQELARCAETVAAMAAVVTESPAVPSAQTRRRAGLSRLLRPRIAATLTAGALVLSFGGLAEAGVLPGPVQHAAHVMFSTIGLSVPDSTSSAGGTGPVVATPGAHPTTPPPVPGAGSGPNGHGKGHGRGRGRGHHGGNGNGPSGPHGRSGSHSHGGRHRHGSGTQNHGTGTQSDGGTTTSPPPPSARGLRVAYDRGRGGQHGKKMSATAFRRLQAMADARGESIDAFCSTVRASDSSGKGNGRGTNGKGNGKGTNGGGHGSGGNGRGHGGGTSQGNVHAHRSSHDADAPPGDAAT